jgi:hypothetical protein
MIKTLCTAFIVFVSFCYQIPAVAEDANFKCEFTKGSQGNWDRSSIEIEILEWEDGPITIAQDPYDPQKFLFISSFGNAELNASYTGFGLTFSSREKGLPMFITVFDTPMIGTESPIYYAVLTRHTMSLLSPIPRQFHGTCSTNYWKP